VLGPFAEGGNADLFDIGDARVMKAFRRKSYFATPPLDWRDHEAMTRAMFRTEARAYERLQRHPDLAPYAPNYYGIENPHRVLHDLSDADSRYVGGCGLVLERIAGVATKLSSLDKIVQTKIAAVLKRFRDELDIEYVWDASCFVPGSRAPFTVIDFSTWDGSAYQAALYANGRLTPEQRLLLQQEGAE
jgi:hypothetical protein